MHVSRSYTVIQTDETNGVRVQSKIFRNPTYRGKNSSVSYATIVWFADAQCQSINVRRAREVRAAHLLS